MVGEKILVIATHPDDETLGCGGSLLKLKSEGNQLYWLIITNVSKSLGYSQHQITRRQKEIKDVGDLFGFKRIYDLKYPTTKLDLVPMVQLVNKIGKVIREVMPETIFVPNRSDIHSDHRITFNATLSCTKQFRFPYVQRVLMYETISETEFAPPFSDEYFVPSAYINITHFIDEKIRISNVYQSEVGMHPFPRSDRNIRALATFRGATINVDYAEAFMVIKEIFG